MIEQFFKHKIAHGVIAAVSTLPFIFTPYYPYAGLAVIGFFFGREMRDYENKASINPFKSPWKGLMFWKWHSNSQWDYWSAVVVVLINGGIWLWVK